MPDRPSHHRSDSMASSEAQAAAVQEALSAFLEKRPGADENLVRILEKPVRDAARAFLGFDNEEVNDVVQETCLAVLKYIRKQEGFQGNLISFSVTISRNRCRNILNWNRRWQTVPIDSLSDWIEHPERSPLELLDEKEINAILHETLDNLDHPCGLILRGFYTLDRSADSLRRELGLKSVQGVYYLRDRCLNRAYKALKKRLSVCSSDGGPD